VRRRIRLFGKACKFLSHLRIKVDQVEIVREIQPVLSAFFTQLMIKPKKPISSLCGAHLRLDLGAGQRRLVRSPRPRGDHLLRGGQKVKKCLFRHGIDFAVVVFPRSELAVAHLQNASLNRISKVVLGEAALADRWVLRGVVEGKKFG
jgi:hypothetical protein